MLIEVSILKDRNNFYPEGCVKSVNCSSSLGGFQSIVTEESTTPCIDFGELGSIAKFNAPGTTKALKIIDPILGPLWITGEQATVVAFITACACCTGAGSGGGSTAIPIEAIIGSPEADALGFQDGDTNLQDARMAGHNILFFRDFGLDGSFNPGNGDAWHTPKLLAADNFTISQALQDGEHILILIL